MLTVNKKENQLPRLGMVTVLEAVTSVKRAIKFENDKT